jgi:hypothetical protein
MTLPDEAVRAQERIIELIYAPGRVTKRDMRQAARHLLSGGALQMLYDERDRNERMNRPNRPAIGSEVYPVGVLSYLGKGTIHSFQQCPPDACIVRFQKGDWVVGFDELKPAKKAKR